MRFSFAIPSATILSILRSFDSIVYKAAIRLFAYCKDAFLDSLAFAYCSNLEVAVVRAEIEVLNEKVFVNSVVNAAGTVYTDTSLKEVYLPSTLTKIHSTALSGNRISDIYFTGSEEQWNELYFFEMQKSEDDGDEYEEVRLEKSDVLSDSVTVHFNAEYPSLK